VPLHKRMRTGVSSEEEQTPEKPRRKRKISEDDFVVDDEDEIEEMSESEEDVGFYARVSQMMDKRENRMTGMGETLSPRAAFWEFLKYNGIRMISKFAKFPENSKTLKRMLPAMEAGAKKIEQEMTARKKKNYTLILEQAIGARSATQQISRLLAVAVSKPERCLRRMR
jgi:hypothetical protein